MDNERRELAEKVLKHLCLGGQITDILFEPAPRLLISHLDEPKYLIRGQIYIYLESKWQIYSESPLSYPSSEEEIEDLLNEELSIINELKMKKITNIKIDSVRPHLTLTLEDGKEIFLWGHHEKYECWEVGVYFARDRVTWLVIACPGDDLIVCAPDEFINDTCIS